MNERPTVQHTTASTEEGQRFADLLIELTVPFSVEPRPHDEYLFTFPSEHLHVVDERWEG